MLMSFQYAEHWQTGKNLAFSEGSVVNEYIRSCNDTLFKTKIDEINTPFKTKSSENHTLSGRTSPLRPYRGVPPPPGCRENSTSAANELNSRKDFHL